MNSTNGAHEFTKRKLERCVGSLEGWGSGRSAKDPRFNCASQISIRENLQAPSSETWT